MIRQTLLIAFILLLSKGNAQQDIHSNYNWDDNPEYSVEDQSKELVAIQEKIIEEFVFEGKDFVEYLIEHRVLWLNSDDAIEKYNRVYLPLSSDSKLIENKARVIKKNGDIQLLDKSKILTAEDEETGRNYKYFAFEGVEKGSFIEYFFIQKKSPSAYGKRVNFQHTYDKYNLEFDLYAPTNLEFAFKSFNGLPKVEKEESNKNFTHWKLRVDHMPGLQEEDGSPYNASKAFLIYKIHKNSYNNKVITSYASVAKNLYDVYYEEYKNRTIKDIDEFISNIGISEDMDADEVIRKVDMYIKKHIYLAEAGNESLMDMEDILENKAANERGVVKLYIAIFRHLDIDHQIVLTTNRLDMKFDDAFEANNFLQEFLMYFPATDKYLALGDFDSFYGFPPAYLTDNYGLFVDRVNVGVYSSAVAQIKYIKPVKAEESVDNMQIDVSFEEEDLTTNTIEFKRTMNGYYAMYIQPFLDLIKPDQKDEVLNSFAKQIDENAEVVNREEENNAPEFFGVKPLVLHYKITSTSFVEKAGNKYLFKVGNLIGPQVEMYQDKKRVLSYENEFNRVYDRTINVNIPEGYTVSNPEDINIQNVYKNDEGAEVFAFHSYYQIDGNTLTITADEVYRKNIIPVEQYEEFRKVINSAADFNKITLVLEPQ